MYSVQYLPTARQDMIEIVEYITRVLKNPQAAEKLAREFVKRIELTRDFPYANPSYQPIRKLKNEYRRIIIENYSVFYTVDEVKRIVTISRVIYSKRNLELELN